MKFNFKKISAVFGSALLTLGLTAVPTMADDKAPFVENGETDVAVVYGSTADLDAVETIESWLGLEPEEVAVGVGEEYRSLSVSTDFLYLGQPLNFNVDVISDEDLPTLLAEGLFTDYDGTDYEYDQEIIVGNDSEFTFDAARGLDDPELLISLARDNPAFTYRVVFDDPIDFTDSDTHGEEITLLGEEYTVSTRTGDGELVLLRGAAEETINVFESATATVEGQAYEIEILGIDEREANRASIVINGEERTITEGQTRKVAGIDVHAKTIFRIGEERGHVTLLLGADEITFQNGRRVEVGTGADAEHIDGTRVTIDSDLTDVSLFEVAFASDDREVRHVPIGGSFIDTVFEKIALSFEGIENGPVLDVHRDTSTDRKSVEIDVDSDEELSVHFTEKGGYDVDLPFAHWDGSNTVTGSEDANLVLYENATLVEDDMMMLNVGRDQYLFEVQVVDYIVAAADPNEFTVVIEDILSGNDAEFTIESDTPDGEVEEIRIGTRYFDVEVHDADAGEIGIYSRSYSNEDGGEIKVFPYMELYTGEDTRVAVVQDTQIELFNADAGETIDIVLPDSTVTISADVGEWQDGGEGIWKWAGVEGNTMTIGLNETETGVDSSDPVLLLMEEEDNSDGNKKHIVFVGTDTDEEIGVDEVEFTTENVKKSTFDDSDYTGYLTPFGTYVLEDSSGDQTVATLTVPRYQMHANVYIGSVATEDTVEVTGEYRVRDDETAAMEGKNLIVVGGSCINSVAATLVGGAFCGADWTAETGAGEGHYVIQTYENPYDEEKIATLVAGYEAADTRAAATRLTQGGLDLEPGKEYVLTEGVEGTMLIER